MQPSYAVFFRTHFWDEFTRRQLRRLCAQVQGGDVFVVVDGTFGEAPRIDVSGDEFAHLGPEPVIVVKAEDLRAFDLEAVTTHGSVIWYNPDYLNYVAAARLGAYDYYVSVEYDVVVNTGLDGMIGLVARDQVDYVGFDLRGPVAAWPWFGVHEPIYGGNMLHRLSCISVFSKRALDVLLARRQAQAQAFRAGVLEFWPNNEAFIPNEICRAGLVQRSLSDYGATSRYDWWPPTNEAALAAYANEAFIHPVLPGKRFVRSVLFHEPSFLALLWPRSSAWRRLDGFAASEIRPMVIAETRRRVRAKLLRIAQRLGLRPAWFERARSGAMRAGQEASAHNAG